MEINNEDTIKKWYPCVCFFFSCFIVYAITLGYYSSRYYDTIIISDNGGETLLYTTECMHTPLVEKITFEFSDRQSCVFDRPLDHYYFNSSISCDHIIKWIIPPESYMIKKYYVTYNSTFDASFYWDNVGTYSVGIIRGSDNLENWLASRGTKNKYAIDASPSILGIFVNKHLEFMDEFYIAVYNKHYNETYEFNMMYTMNLTRISNVCNNTLSKNPLGSMDTKKDFVHPFDNDYFIVSNSDKCGNSTVSVHCHLNGGFLRAVFGGTLILLCLLIFFCVLYLCRKKKTTVIVNEHMPLHNKERTPLTRQIQMKSYSSVDN
jgi:hypothetical protein